MIEFRHATPELAREIMGRDPPWSFRGHVAVLDGRPVGIAGIARVGADLLAFSQAVPGLSRRDVVRCMRFMAGVLSGLRVPVYAECCGSLEMLRRLGFTPTGEEGWMVRHA